MADFRGYHHGSVVAFEGSSSLISTQLRLLPISPQILILPPIQNYLRDQDEPGISSPSSSRSSSRASSRSTPSEHRHNPFDAKSYIRRVHDAAVARQDTARTFLRESTPTSKRLVFMNGGAAAARAACIQAIARHDTDSDMDSASTVYRDLVEHGLAGLEAKPDPQPPLPYDQDDSSADDPITRAMRAAETLDRLTASLQPIDALDWTCEKRPRSVSLPLYGLAADHFGDSVPFYVFGAPPASVMANNDVSSPGLVEDYDHTTHRGGALDPTYRYCQAPEAISQEHNAVASTTNSKQVDHIWHHPPIERFSRVPSCVGETYRPPPAAPCDPGTQGLSLPQSDSPGAIDIDNDIFYGRAALVDIRASKIASSGNPLKPTMSLDRIHYSPSREGIFGLSQQLDQAYLRHLRPKPPKAASSSLELHSLEAGQRETEDGTDLPASPHYRSHSSNILAGDASSIPSRQSSRPGQIEISSTQSPQALVERSSLAISRALIRLLAPPSVSRSPARPCYVDRGTDPDYFRKDSTPAPFQPVLPFVEDFVIYFKDRSQNLLLESVMESIKADDIPHPSLPALIVLPASIAEGDDYQDIPANSRTPKFGQISVPISRYASSTTTTTFNQPRVHSLELDEQEYDPFSCHPSPFARGKVEKQRLQQQQQQQQQPPSPLLSSPSVQTQSRPTPPSPSARMIDAIKAKVPPTPAHTPPPSASSVALGPPFPLSTAPDSKDRFHSFDITDCPNAVAIQNNLRSVLNIYFPLNLTGYRQFLFPLLPELDGFWRPIFHLADEDSARGCSKLDLILAVGSQKAVKKEFASAVVGRLEDLGIKSSGLRRSVRSIRLDFRYLIANAMQSFTAQPLANQTHDNPFTNPYLLATLVIPPLETYLAAHSGVRFLLLDYGPDHLSTVLALQKLVGVDAMKVAQIVDSTLAGSLPFNHLRGRSISGASTVTVRVSDSTPTVPAPETLAICEANYLLTATASESEVSTFVNTIRRLLTEVSSFYLREDRSPSPPPPPVKPAVAKTVVAKPSLSRASRGGSVHSLPLTTVPAAMRRSSGTVFPQLPPPPAPVSSTRPGSPAQSTRSGKSGRSRATTFRMRLRSGMTEGLDSGDESELDPDERRLMPLFLRRPIIRKGNTHKALKFLGLA